ncbi:hypothetical protein DID76_02035 [Candidatus Marinamargulisbacteria bacterium SCGC AG-414-C22]|nr:hypothetical protein DID76_02035 [Candidatus Marinamargulisbacteria bacterium SCGC AG-414-C22]
MKFEHLWGDIFLNYKKKSMISILENTELFSNISMFYLKQLSKIFHERSYQKNETVFEIGEPGESVYIIKSGSVTISNKTKKEAVTLTAGAFFGELSLVDENPRTVTATATESTELIVFFRADLMHLKSRNPQLAVKLFYNLANILGKRISLISANKSSIYDS